MASSSEETCGVRHISFRTQTRASLLCDGNAHAYSPAYASTDHDAARIVAAHDRFIVTLASKSRHCMLWDLKRNTCAPLEVIGPGIACIGTGTELHALFSKDSQSLVTWCTWSTPFEIEYKFWTLPSNDDSGSSPPSLMFSLRGYTMCQSADGSRVVVVHHDTTQIEQNSIVSVYDVDRAHFHSSTPRLVARRVIPDTLATYVFSMSLSSDNATVALVTMRDEYYENMFDEGWDEDEIGEMYEVMLWPIGESENTDENVRVERSALPTGLEVDDECHVRFMSGDRTLLVWNKMSQKVLAYDIPTLMPSHTWENVDDIEGVHGTLLLLAQSTEGNNVVVYDHARNFERVASVPMPKAYVNAVRGGRVKCPFVHESEQLTNDGRYLHFTRDSDTWRLDLWHTPYQAEKALTVLGLPTPLAHLVSTYAVWTTKPTPSA